MMVMKLVSFAKLCEVLHIEEFIFYKRRFAIAGGIRGENPLALALGVGFKRGQPDCPAENCQEQSEDKNDEEQTTLLKAKFLPANLSGGNRG